MHETNGCSGLYEPLRPGHIRLLRLQSSTDAILECSFETFELSSVPDYFALSYVWGDAATDAQLLLHGMTIPVSQNLLAGLRAIQKFERTLGELLQVRVWIDALCIDQSSIPEKSEQIPMMDRIYSGAYCVLIWMSDMPQSADVVYEALYWCQVKHEIGVLAKDDSEDTDFLEHETERLALSNVAGKRRRMNQLKSRLQRSLIGKQSADEMFWAKKIQKSSQRLQHQFGVTNIEIEAFHYLIVAILDLKTEPSGMISDERVMDLYNKTWATRALFDPDHVFWTALFTFMDHDWFYRAWTYQEVMLARTAAVLCPDGRIFDWHVVRACRGAMLLPINFGVLYKHKHATHSKHSAILNDSLCSEFDRVQYLKGPEGSQSLSHLLLSASHREAKMPKDHIYGLLGLVDDPFEQKIAIQYSADDAAVFMQAFLLIIGHEPSLLPQFWERYSNTHVTTRDLPSWCPDFSVSTGKESHMGQAREVLSTEFEERYRCSARIEHGITRSQIGFLGLRLDSVAVRGPKCPKFDLAQHYQSANSVCAEDWVIGPFRYLFGPNQRNWLRSLALTFPDCDKSCHNEILIAYLSSHTREIPDSIPHVRKLLTFVEELESCKTLDSHTILQVLSKLQISKQIEFEKLKMAMFCILVLCSNTNMFRTDTGRLGVTAKEVQSGDHIIYVPGGYNAHILSADGKRYVGCASIEGLLVETVTQNPPASLEELEPPWEMFWIS